MQVLHVNNDKPPISLAFVFRQNKYGGMTNVTVFLISPFFGPL